MNLQQEEEKIRYRGKFHSAQNQDDQKNLEKEDGGKSPHEFFVPGFMMEESHGDPHTASAS